MQCKKCGAQLPDDAQFCSSCGTSTFSIPSGQPQQSDQQPAAAGQSQPGQPFAGTSQQFAAPKMTKKEFFHHPDMKKQRTNINTSGICMYVFAGVTLLVNVILASNPQGLLDVLLLAVLGLGIQLGKSRVAAVLACIYSIFNMVYMLAATGKVSGYLIVLAAVYGTTATFQFQKAWKEYQASGKIG